VEIRGTGEPLLLFVPGWGCDRTVWDRLTPFLQRRFRVALFDPRGFGESQDALVEPGGWSLTTICADIMAILEALGTPRAVVVGSSLGGIASLRLASAPPPCLEGVVAIGASPCPTRKSDFPYGFPPETVAAVLAGLRADFAGTCAAIAPGYFEAGKEEEEALLKETMSRVSDRRWAIEILERGLGADIRSDLASIRLPVLLLHGQVDASAPPEVGEYTRSQVPASRLAVIEGAGHLPQLTVPAAVAEEIEAFTNRIAAAIPPSGKA
jgi:sigma-B regulation protein RsbQ